MHAEWGPETQKPLIQKDTEKQKPHEPGILVKETQKDGVAKGKLVLTAAPATM